MKWEELETLTYDGPLVGDSSKLVHSRNTGGEPELIIIVTIGT